MPNIEQRGSLLQLLTDSQSAMARLFEHRARHLGLTRPQWLVLSGLWPPKGTRERSHASLLRRRALAPPDLVAGFCRLADRGDAAFFDAAEARWVFPDLSPSRAVAVAGDEDGRVPVASPAEVEPDA